MSSGDRAALVALFRSTGGTRWRFSNNWDTKADLSKWHGVEVNDDGRVVKLVLLSNNLKGTIPDAVGALTELRALYLIGNKLTGPIPEALGALKELAHLGLGDNKLTGSIPAWLGSLKKLQQLGLHSNQLGGPIPEALGALQELTILGLDHNQLKGSIPAWLGSLTNLQQLGLHSNELAGPIPEALGALQELTMLGLGDNKLTGSIPAWLGSLKKLQQLGLNGNQLAGLIPEALGALKELRHLYLNDNKLTGPIPEALGVLKELLDLCLNDNNLTGSIPTWLGSLSKLQRLELSDNQLFDPLIRENPEALEDTQRVIGSPVAGSFHPADQLSDMGRRRKLGTLLTMSTALGEAVLRHTEDMDIQRKERALAPFSKAYYAAVRSGLRNAYLAASVIDSDWVSTSKTGRVGKAGATLKLVSSAVPAVGGLPKLAGKALETGDHFLQTRRLVKITGIAPDAMECCFLARGLALQLAEGLKDDAGAGADEADHVHVHATAGMNGGSESGRGADMMPGDMSEDDVFEYLLEEVAIYESNDRIEILLLEILPEADVRPAATSSTPKEVIVRAPAVVAAAHDSGLPSMADSTTLLPAVEALASVKDKQQAELEALKSDRKSRKQKLKQWSPATKSSGIG